MPDELPGTQPAPTAPAPANPVPTSPVPTGPAPQEAPAMPAPTEAPLGDPAPAAPPLQAGHGTVEAEPVNPVDKHWEPAERPNVGTTTPDAYPLADREMSRVDLAGDEHPAA